MPLLLEEQGLAKAVCKKLKLDKETGDNKNWVELNKKINTCKEEVKIALVGKYMQLEDSYLSVVESLRHGGYENGVKVKVGFIDSEKVTKESAEKILKDYQGILVPGGFGNRGIEGKIEAIKYARENKKPFLGICLGMQMAVVEFARNVLNLKDANSAEFDEESQNHVIHIMETQKKVTKKGGTMRLGAYPCIIKEGTLAEEVYKSKEISERHRHRFEYNNEYK